MKPVNQITETTGQIAALVSEGLMPHEIASRIGIPTKNVIRLLYAAIDEGRVSKAEVMFNFKGDFLKEIEILDFFVAYRRNPPEKVFAFISAMSEGKVDEEEIKLYLRYREKRVHVGEMYELISGFERFLHRKLKTVLIAEFGREEAQWWREGVPEAVRVACATAREKDTDFLSETYSYTTLLHLWEIMTQKEIWKVLKLILPGNLAVDREKLGSNFKKFNRIRNQVMHPVRSEPPTQDDYEFIREMHRAVVEGKWKG